MGHLFARALVKSYGFQRREGEECKMGEHAPSSMRKLCMRASSKTSRRRSTVEVTPVGLQPYYLPQPSVNELSGLRSIQIRLPRVEVGHTGTVYRTLGFGLSRGQLSSISRRPCASMP